MNTTEFLDEVKHINLVHLGSTYQAQLYSVARSIGAKVAVEAGVRSGVSTRYLMEAILKNGAKYNEQGVFSCDPMYPLGQKQAAPKVQAASQVPSGPWFFSGKRSVEALPLFVNGTESTGYPLNEWDIFLADGDHNCECQIFELEFALGYVREGGLIAVNNWKGPPEKLPHGQVPLWAARHGLEGVVVGTAMFFESPGPQPGTLQEKWHNAVQAGIDAVVQFRTTKDGASERPALTYYLDKTV